MIMTSFTKNEIVSATNLVRQFSNFLNLISQKTMEKIAIVRNNEMEAVILPIEEYERLKELEQKHFSARAPKSYFGIISDEDFDELEIAGVMNPDPWVLHSKNGNRII